MTTTTNPYDKITITLDRYQAEFISNMFAATSRDWLSDNNLTKTERKILSQADKEIARLFTRAIKHNGG